MYSIIMYSIIKLSSTRIAMVVCLQTLTSTHEQLRRGSRTGKGLEKYFWKRLQMFDESVKISRPSIFILFGRTPVRFVLRCLRLSLALALSLINTHPPC
jgi:hypothetical protein